MTYRTSKAQLIHGSLLNYLRTRLPEDLSQLEHSLSDADEHALMEPSINGDSHLIDILHLPLEINFDSNTSYTIMVELQRLLMKACIHYPKAKAFLLLTPNQAGFTPLHQALISGNEKNLKVYLRALQEAQQQKLITQEEYVHVLIGANQAGFTPLHEALISGNEKNLSVYFTALQKAREQKLITQEEYVNVLIGANQAGFTPLHEALKSGKEENLAAYFTALQKAREQKLITQEEYVNVLIGANQAGFTPLHTALISGNEKNLNVYLGAVQSTLVTRVLCRPEYRALLANPNKAGYTPLHQAANSGSLSVVKAFYEIMHAEFNDKELEYYLNLGNRKPSCQPHKLEARAINSYLDQKRNGLRQRYCASKQTREDSRERSSRDDEYRAIKRRGDSYEYSTRNDNANQQNNKQQYSYQQSNNEQQSRCSNSPYTFSHNMHNKRAREDSRDRSSRDYEQPATKKRADFNEYSARPHASNQQYSYQRTKEYEARDSKKYYTPNSNNKAPLNNKYPLFNSNSRTCESENNERRADRKDQKHCSYQPA